MRKGLRIVLYALLICEIILALCIVIALVVSAFWEKDFLGMSLYSFMELLPRILGVTLAWLYASSEEFDNTLKAMHPLFTVVAVIGVLLLTVYTCFDVIDFSKKIG